MPHKGHVYVIDDDPAMRDSLEFLLDSADYAVTLYESALTFLDSMPNLPFGCIVSDVRMPGMDGMDLLKQLKSERARLPVVMMTGHGDVPLAVEAMKSGVADFLEKPFDDEQLLSAVRAALDSKVSEDRNDTEKQRFEGMLAGLSPREQDVLRGVVAGKPNKIIAYELGISPRTVEVYRANVMTKTGAASLSELVRMALLAGF